ncbi:malate dehydrogenase [Blattabacterium cuenoti]|uniref:malate dehydrogenase n=1 Tax=Blattabacterium cuenoti TaxID=1653831 RepID=UPI00163BE0E6|nr:malate dehydrogenase [Blattabacterium cuenoti]
MKITIIGSGNVGLSCATLLAQQKLATQIILLDIKENISKGKSLDLAQMLPLLHSDTKVLGISNNEFDKTKNSDITIITSGYPRTPGMSRDELININAQIILSVTKQSIIFSPKTKFIIVSNPLDVMTYVSYIVSKIDASRIIGMGGILDSIRYRYFLSKELHCSPRDIHTVLLGTHGDYMIPLYRYTSVSGIPIHELISKEKNNVLIEKTKKGGEEIVNFLGTSSWLAPGASILQIVESIIKDSKRILSCSVFLNGEYNLSNICLGVPIVVGKNGIEKILELHLNKEEKLLLIQSANQVQNMICKLELLNEL